MSSIKQNITSDGGLPWRQLSQGWWAGHIYADEHWLNSRELEQLLAAIHTLEELKATLASWNGSFALCWVGHELSFAATDIARSIPVFWSVKEDIIISNRLKRTDGRASGWAQNKILVQTEFTPGHTTLLADWQQLQAGEILEIRDGLCFIHNYFPHRRPAPYNSSRAQLKVAFNDLIHEQVDRLIRFADGRTIVIPLSGGYDSRILLAALHKQGYKQLKAFTYGQADSWEVRLAETIARTLQIDWKFVHYSPELLQTFWSEQWRTFAHYASNGCSLPQEQDFFALHSLKQAGWLEPGSIICPGYCGDFQAGSYLPKPQLRWPGSRIKALQQLLYHRFIRYPSGEVFQQWRAFLPQADIPTDTAFVSELEHWVLREYVSKFIVNGVRAYEFFDCSWYLPLWDRAFIEFWQRVPNPYRKNMRLYREVLEEEWFKPYGISFPEDQSSSSIRTKLLHWIPVSWKEKLKKWRPAKPISNINGLHQLVPEIQRRLDWPAVDTSISVNEMIGHWYLQEFINNKDQ